MPEDIKTAVIYARFSCSKQREASIDDQLRVCRDWCAREGCAIVGEYSDYAMSGRSDDRPQFQKMIASAGESDIVLVYMMDRFSRDEYDAPAYKHELRKKGVEVVSAMEEEVRREDKANKERQRLYSRKYRAKKQINENFLKVENQETEEE